MHFLAAGWFLSIGWLWVAGIQQHIRRRGGWPPDYGAPILIEGLISTVVMEILAILFVRWAGGAPDRALERREWIHAFWWSVFPNFMLFVTVYVLLEALR